ncbi:3-hydroxyacyl-ACP dehydratase FabZ [Rickettsiales endosymbiont of Peranema trichophorum]|uniref:3-hydroxyacyl-ACP dehydratase FabZ n=1 Tax=Rickettsiales endosymbiont of Peranema trichophorum TaxID=2486577 RepID=UPI001022BEB7|nr:3-hydroxyacyl-ACP dehydratase FabZ [Rickettsiales endosymbiont of Peranema trichophorum]RZI47189.1 3-hydroxyacyl-ACP dehydratase FabZ [Rickettsiales endosymbiont of Peranema trichophorum]
MLGSVNISVDTIMELIPHRYPFLLIDRIISTSEDAGLVALKNVSINEHFFVGHFPKKPIMPGVLIIEAMAQASAAFIILSGGVDAKNKMVYFMSIDEAHFRKPVIPGDALYIHVQKIKNRTKVWKMRGEARIDGTRVADAVFTAMMID